MLPKISILTPSFNQGHFIEETIISILDQNYSNLEYIIIDGGSTDNTIDIIKKYKKHLSYWISQKDNGQSDAINKGIRYCTGDIFNWINSDDTLLPGTLHYVSEYFQNIPSLIGLSGKCNICSSDMNYIETRGTEYYKTIEKTIVNKVFNQPATFYSMDAIRYSKGVNTSLNFVMDLELWFKIILKYGLSCFMTTDKVFANFRLHDYSKTVDKESYFSIEENGLYWDLLHKLFIESPLMDIYSENKNYLSEIWDLSLIDKDNLMKEIIEKEFFNMYINNKFVAFRYAFFKKILNNSIPLNRHILRMFLKAYLHI